MFLIVFEFHVRERGADNCASIAVEMLCLPPLAPCMYNGVKGVKCFLLSEQMNKYWGGWKQNLPGSEKMLVPYTVGSTYIEV